MKHDDIIFSNLNDVGALLDQHYHLPFIMVQIEVEGKEGQYIGSVISVKMKGGTVESGDFHPYLKMDYFEAFTIYPNKFTIKNIIDIDAPPDSTTLNGIFSVSSLFDKITTRDIGVIRRNIPELLILFKKYIQEFNSIHPDHNIERALYLTNEAIEMCENFTSSTEITENNIVNLLATVKANIMEGIRTFIFQGNKKEL